MLTNFSEIRKKYDLSISGIIHVGAHYGEEIKEYIDNGICEIILFEPLEENYNFLKKKIENFNINIKCYKIALGSKKATATMYVSDNNKESSSILKPKLHLEQYPQIKFNSTEQVTIDLLDSYYSEKYNFINMDVQGYELEVLKGATNSLKGIDYIYSEVNRAEVYENNAYVEELDKFLLDYDFKRVTTNWAGGNWGDALYIKEKRLFNQVVNLNDPFKLNNPIETVKQILIKNPELSKDIAKMAHLVQGIGYQSSIKKENEVVHKLLGRKPNIAIDIGGHIGEYTSELRTRNPDLEIYIFEPSEINIKKLNIKFGNDKLIKILPFAVSDKNGSATLYSDKIGSEMGSLIKRNLKYLDIDFDVTEKVKTICFEDYWKRDLHKRVLDIVKIDIEGNELAALKGFGKAIYSTNIIQFELGGTNIDSRTYFKDFWYFFKERNFSLFRISPLGAERILTYDESEEYFSFMNLIALNND